MIWLWARVTIAGQPSYHWAIHIGRIEATYTLTNKHWN